MPRSLPACLARVSLAITPQGSITRPAPPATQIWLPLEQRWGEMGRPLAPPAPLHGHSPTGR